MVVIIVMDVVVYGDVMVMMMFVVVMGVELCRFCIVMVIVMRERLEGGEG